MSRSLLHITKLKEFKEFLDQKGIKYRSGSGEWQVLQVQPKGSKLWCCIYERSHMPEHYTNDKRLDALVLNFCRSLK